MTLTMCAGKARIWSIMNETGSDGRKEISTTFRLRVWWLVAVRGYKLESKRRLPKESPFGEIYYKNHWVLCKVKKD